MNLQEVTRDLARSTERFYIAVGSELDGKKTTAEAIEIARQSIHKMADLAADDALKRSQDVQNLMQMFSFQTEEDA